MTNARTSKSNEFAFVPGDLIVYPAYGVAKVVNIETQTVGTEEVRVVVVNVEEDRLTIRVPLHKAKALGMRRLSSGKIMQVAFQTMTGRASKSRGMWSRRAVEYATKIKTGDPITLAEVVRDLHRGAGQPEPSYSERLIYEQARDRLAREVAAIEKVQFSAATTKLEKLLNAA
jgi:CarD family transcriptional regulator